MRKLQRTSQFAAAILFVLASKPAGAQNLVDNGGFDTGDFTDFTISGCSTPPVGYDVAYAVSPGYDTPPNPYAIFRCGNNLYTSLAQYLATTPNQLYTISFRGVNTAGGVEASPGNRVRIFFGGVNVFDYPIITGLNGMWQQFTTTGVASTSSNTALRFEVYNNQGETYIDDISVTRATSTVPEPSSLALLGTGLLGLVPMIGRRRRR